MAAPEGEPLIEEVRLALVLNGGVSLAVWMGGCAVELDIARRARWDGPPEPVDELDGGTSDRPPRAVYQALCAAFRRELVIDVMSGASAGGINGALLAAAMSHARRLHPTYVRNSWLELGDVSALMHPLDARRPTSLMRGQLFSSGLFGAFRDVCGDRTGPHDWSLLPPGHERPKRYPALDITTTNLVGEPLSARDTWGGTLSTRDHRARFRFREPDDFTPADLASAARASASFPVAFEPFLVAAGEHGDGPRRLAEMATDRWVVDGGLLDNAPIRAALDLIPTRPADQQVQRVLCYVNGDPGAPLPAVENVTATLRPGALEAAVRPPPDAPVPTAVLGAIIGVPRRAPFADHLRAIQALSTRSELSLRTELALLGLEQRVLTTTATALFDGYRRARTLRSLQELIGDPGLAQATFARIEQRGLHDTVPWIPAVLARGTPEQRARWGWGFEAARRIHHLALDLLRRRLAEGGNELADVRATVGAARTVISSRATAIDTARRSFEQRDVVRAGVRELPEATGQLREAARAGDVELLAGVRETALVLLGLTEVLGTFEGVDVGAALFGPGAAGAELTDARFETFLERVLSVEVVRRAMAGERAIDDGQPIAFAQLTPDTPSPLFPGLAASAHTKLCGIGLGHFSGFYRRSWRANDYLWGRLDAAARIVQLLVDGERITTLARWDGELPWERLGDALLSAGEAQTALVAATLDAHEPSELPLADRLSNALVADLSAEGATGTLTRQLFTQAAQFEIMREELPVLRAAARSDERLGATGALRDLPGLEALQTDAGIQAALATLQTGDTLPERLGRDDPREHASDLAVRTATHAGLIGLGYLRATKLPFTAPLQGLRGLLLSMAGTVARRPLDRAAAFAAFWAAALLLAARVTSTDPDAPADLMRLDEAGLAVALLAVLVVTGTAAVPAFRAFWVGKGHFGVRLRQGAWALGLLAVGGLLAIAIALTAGDVPAWGLVVAAGYDVDWPVAGLVLAIGTGAAVVVPRSLRARVAHEAEPAWRGALSALAVIAASTVIAAWVAERIVDAIGDGGWRAWAALLAVVAAPVAAGAYLFARQAVSARWRERRRP